MADHGIKFGSNINTNTDLELDITSEYGMLKMFKWGDVDLELDGSATGSTTVTHGMDYSPLHILFRKFTAQYTFLSATTHPDAYTLAGMPNCYVPTDNNISAVFNADDTNLNISNFPSIGIPISGGPQANTTYSFRYIIFVDKSENFTGASNITLTGDRGFKFTPAGVNVFTAEEYQKLSSSQYKFLQYYPNHVVSESLTLPAMRATLYDASVEEATYVDFNHNLNYPPYFMLFTDNGVSGRWYGGPLYEFVPDGLGLSGYSEISAWCDDEKVRVVFKRESHAQSGVYGTDYAEKTINVKVIMFTENLAGSASP